MHRLYFVRFYNHPNNQFVRVLVTAPDEEQAIVKAHEFDEVARVQACTFICETPEEVAQEVR